MNTSEELCWEDVPSQMFCRLGCDCRAIEAQLSVGAQTPAAAVVPPQRKTMMECAFFVVYMRSERPRTMRLSRLDSDYESGSDRESSGGGGGNTSTGEEDDGVSSVGDVDGSAGEGTDTDGGLEVKTDWELARGGAAAL